VESKTSVNAHIYLFVFEDGDHDQKGDGASRLVGGSYGRYLGDFLGLTAYLYLTAFHNRPFHSSLYSHIKLIFNYFLL